MSLEYVASPFLAVKVTTGFTSFVVATKYNLPSLISATPLAESLTAQVNSTSLSLSPVDKVTLVTAFVISNLTASATSFAISSSLTPRVIVYSFVIVVSPILPVIVKVTTDFVSPTVNVNTLSSNLAPSPLTA